MQINSTPRVVYNKNPLVEVVCQVSYFPILELQNSSPSEFQKKVTEEFPKSRVDASVAFPFPQISIMGTTNAGQNIYHFISADEKWRISVCNTFFALTSHDYKDWDLFKNKFLQAWKHFATTTSLTLGQRIGLRYRNVIDRKLLGLGDTPWRELISPFIAGVFSAKDLCLNGEVPEQAVINSVSQAQLNLEKCQILLQTGLLHTGESTEKAFLIDSDCFQQSEFSLTSETISTKMEELHADAGALFRRSIETKLHTALGPPKTGG